MARKKSDGPTPESEPERDDPHAVKHGETARFTCGFCSVEFEVTPEPKTRGAAGVPDANTVVCCPFCNAGAAYLEQDD